LKTIMEMRPEEVKYHIKNGKLTICVVGLGWMGLPTACLFAEAGANVIGVDVNEYIIEQINKGKSHIHEPDLKALVEKHVKERKLIAIDDIEEAGSKSDVFVIIVPTGIDYRKRPDYSSVEKVSKDVGKSMNKGSLVIFESTTAPGITESIVKKTLERVSGFKAGIDFGLAYSPIRATAGTVLVNIQNYPRVIAGINKRSLKLASAVLSTIVKERMVNVRNLQTAEATKLFENVYRDVNIALANELAMFCEKAGIDFMEVREAANTQPYSNLHVPSVGVGGHCIPVNPYFLIDEAEAVRAKVRLVEYARKVNDGMPAHTVKVIQKALREKRKTLMRTRITVLGISFKPNVKEAKYSPVIEVIKKLQRKGSRVTVYDPYFTAKEIEELGFQGADTLKEAIEKIDCILIAVAHERFKKLRLSYLSRYSKHPLVIVDSSHFFDLKEKKDQKVIYREIGNGIFN